MLLIFLTRLDATIEDGSFGRLINDNNKNPNCVAKVLYNEGIPCVGFFAAARIAPGQELRYCYGKGDYLWRRKVRNTSSEPDTILDRTSHEHIISTCIS